MVYSELPDEGDIWSAAANSPLSVAPEPAEHEEFSGWRIFINLLRGRGLLLW